ncbi:VRR-NUC domain-containing protein [Pseudomonas sp. CCI3.2]|uniref:VRR-NUC domain-containing protein n=1 Tax=unclassified Pseudomonas TaxID=196821 RepID=UPI002AC9B4CF|nr:MULTISPECIES: VRR-NUC domain-containing protein [unclassified Pseudomonas]MEB0080146.1 VRR-NUC domain-containing protein [Pseudomonas sp. MH10out]MEB0093926.1 VRR-NUC domain-containing protein [Pseudomonas sp. CCI4.2]MEB0102414.1 VRR-NUC domain-containing protein [Pseudomonas sp. CCI3.2]MEB0133008.1 VRR-NUC domain-containing protein [Pseudomonas sp. CCI2.4]MEB0160152.1 VRR-NUC domain-containing protein [Pseudomonas sp. AH2 (2023)]
MNSSPLDNPFYYLVNFQHVLEWIAERYTDVLDRTERQFINDFIDLPQTAQGLLVRMVMRKGTLFRASKLSYAEIGDPASAVQPLLKKGWVDPRPAISLDELFGLLRKAEVVTCFTSHGIKIADKKTAMFERLHALYPEPQPIDQWHRGFDEPVYGLTVMALCERLRLLYFGNLHQEWSEFVLADLGVYRYEKVEFTAESRGINERADIDTCLQLHRCRQALELPNTLQALTALAQQALVVESRSPWLNMRRAKLLFQIGQQAERLQEWSLALAVYEQGEYPGARLRRIRVLERSADYSAAMVLLESAQTAPENAAEAQGLMRILPRLQRKLGLPAERRRSANVLSRLDITVSQALDLSVEQMIQRHLADDVGPVYYVENTLINSLFGLLCWPAIFAPLPGAFFHPFHSAPSDLYSPDFYQRRAALFDDCLQQLDSQAYQTTVRQHFKTKQGLQSPFVFWGTLTEELLEHALHCLPADHLRHWFRRLLLDIKANRSGMPDLIQFYPAEQRYRMIEVKGPGDRLQDNQLRWLDFCAEHGMPVVVCYVQWSAELPVICPAA